MRLFKINLSNLDEIWEEFRPLAFPGSYTPERNIFGDRSLRLGYPQVLSYIF